MTLTASKQLEQRSIILTVQLGAGVVEMRDEMAFRQQIEGRVLERETSVLLHVDDEGGGSYVKAGDIPELVPLFDELLPAAGGRKRRKAAALEKPALADRAPKEAGSPALASDMEPNSSEPAEPSATTPDSVTKIVAEDGVRAGDANWPPAAEGASADAASGPAPSPSVANPVCSAPVASDPAGSRWPNLSRTVVTRWAALAGAVVVGILITALLRGLDVLPSAADAQARTFYVFKSMAIYRDKAGKRIGEVQFNRGDIVKGMVDDDEPAWVRLSEGRWRGRYVRRQFLGERQPAEQALRAIDDPVEARSGAVSLYESCDFSSVVDTVPANGHAVNQVSRTCLEIASPEAGVAFAKASAFKLPGKSAMLPPPVALRENPSAPQEPRALASTSPKLAMLKNVPVAEVDVINSGTLLIRGQVIRLRSGYSGRAVPTDGDPEKVRKHLATLGAISCRPFRRGHACASNDFDLAEEILAYFATQAPKSGA